MIISRIKIQECSNLICHLSPPTKRLTCATHKELSILCFFKVSFISSRHRYVCNSPTFYFTSVHPLALFTYTSSFEFSSLFIEKCDAMISLHNVVTQSYCSGAQVATHQKMNGSLLQYTVPVSIIKGDVRRSTVVKRRVWMMTIPNLSDSTNSI